LLDAVLTALLAVGGTLVPSSKDGERLYVCMLGQVVGLRVEEIFRREERKLSAAENVAKKKDPYFYFRDRWIYIATGKLKLTLLSDYTYYQYATLSDGANSLIEDRIEHIAERIQAKAADRHVKKQMDEEERLRREAAWAQRKEMESVRDGELAQLEKAEKKAAKWRRAQELRAYAGALESAKVDPSNELATNVAWFRNAADWLDPLVGKKWPAVDI